MAGGFGVNVDFNANLARFTSSLDKATNDLSKFRSNADRIGSNIGKVFAGLGAGLSVDAFVGFIKGSVDALDGLNDLNKKTGISVEQLAGLSLAAKQSGTDLESAASAINKLSKNIGADPEKYRKLGITAKEPLEAFKQLADIFVAIDDPQKRAALGAEAISKSWEAAAPLLAEGGKNIGEMVEKGTRLSQATTEAAQAADKFNDQMAELKAASNGLGTKIASDVIGPMTEITSAIKTAYEESGKLQAAWVALGAVGAFLFTDEFASARTKIKALTEEISELETSKKRFIGPGWLQETLIGSDEEIAAKIASAKQQIAELQSGLQPKAAKPEDKSKPDPDLEKRICEFGGGVWDGKTCKKPDKGPKDDPSKRLLDNSIKDLERLRDQESEILASRNRFLELYNNESLISLKDYYAGRRAAQEENIANQVALIDKEIKVLEMARFKADKDTEKAEFSGKINEAIERKAKIQRQSSEEAIALGIQEANAYDNLGKQIRSLGTDLLDLQGKAAEAAKIRLDDRFEPILKRLSAEGDAGSAKLVQDLKAAQMAYAEFGQSATAASELMESLRATEERLAITRSTGAISELEYLKRISEARAATAAKLEEEVAAQERLGQSSGLKSLQQQAESGRLAMERLRSESDLVGQKFNTIFEESFSNPFADFISGTKTASEAFRSFADSVIQQLARMAAQSVAQQIFGSLFSLAKPSPAGGGGGGFGTSIGGQPVVTAAKGRVFDDSNVTAFAKGGAFTNSIVSSPTLFKFAKGTGLMGEAGPEAIMPLKRGPDGSLGVQASGGSGKAPVALSPTYHITIDGTTDMLRNQELMRNAVEAGNAKLIEDLQNARMI